MDHQKILLGVLFGILGQIGTFLQLQGSYKYGWYEKYPWLVIFASVPLGWLYIKSVNNLIAGAQGQIYISRLLGFSIGIIIFTVMSIVLFNEPPSIKTLFCILLAFLIVAIQLFF
jgi:hypothetical protein